MKVICKKNNGFGSDSYYSSITPEKSYTVVDLSDMNSSVTNHYYVVCDDNNQVGFFLKEYFYTTEELRDRKLNELCI